MNALSKITCFSLASIITACAPAGYYDSNGEYRSYGSSDSFNHNHAMAGTPTTPTNTYSSEPGAATTIIYTRPGYYDRDGRYITADNAPNVPPEFFPPHGMCRVWYTDRPATDEPLAETCQGISHVPVGAYVIYGG